MDIVMLAVDGKKAKMGPKVATTTHEPNLHSCCVYNWVYATVLVIGFGALRLSHFRLSADADCTTEMVGVVALEDMVAYYFFGDAMVPEDSSSSTNLRACQSYFYVSTNHHGKEKIMTGGERVSNKKQAHEEDVRSKNYVSAANRDRPNVSVAAYNSTTRRFFPSGYWAFRNAPKNSRRPSKKEKGIQNVQWRWRDWHSSGNNDHIRTNGNNFTSSSSFIGTVQPLPDSSPDRVAKCLKDKPILFSGDSTTRHVVHDMIRFFLENSTMAPSAATKRKWGYPGPFYHYETPSNSLDKGFGAYHGARDKFTQKVDMWIKDRCRDPNSKHFVSRTRTGESRTPACWEMFEKVHGLKFHKCRKYNETGIANETWSLGFWPDLRGADPSKMKNYWCPNARFGTADLTWKSNNYKGVQVDFRNGPYVHDVKNDAEFFRPYLRANRPALIYLNRGTHDYKDLKPQKTTAGVLRLFQIRLAKTLCLLRENFDGPIVWRHNYDLRPLFSVPMAAFRKAGRQILFGSESVDSGRDRNSPSAKYPQAHAADKNIQELQLHLDCEEILLRNETALLSKMSILQTRSRRNTKTKKLFMERKSSTKLGRDVVASSTNFKQVLWPKFENVFEIDGYGMTENAIANQAFFADGIHFPQKVSRIIWQHLVNFLCV